MWFFIKDDYQRRDYGIHHSELQEKWDSVYSDLFVMHIIILDLYNIFLAIAIEYEHQILLISGQSGYQ